MQGNAGPRERGQYRHSEAFCLMEYATEDGSEREVIWNSRDGVTPYMILSRSGREMRHVNWRRDRCAPDFQPPAGSRMFIDMTRQHALEMARRRLAEHGFDDDPERVQSLAESFLEPPGQPMTVEAGRYGTSRETVPHDIARPAPEFFSPDAIDGPVMETAAAETEKTSEAPDWGAISRLKTAEMRRWERSGHQGSKPKVSREQLVRQRKRERQARKAGRR